MHNNKNICINAKTIAEEDIGALIKSISADEEEHILKQFSIVKKDSNEQDKCGEVYECKLPDCCEKYKYITGNRKYNKMRHVQTRHKYWLIAYLLKSRPDFKLRVVKNLDSYDIKVVQNGSHTIVVTYVISKSDFITKMINIIVSGVSFTLFDHPDFKFFLDPIAKQVVHEVVNSKNVKSYLYNRSGIYKDKIAKICKNKMICIKVDGVKIRGESFLGINCQLIIDGSIKILNLGIVYYNIKSSTENIYSLIMNTLLEYNISMFQILVLTVDNGRNMIKLAELLPSSKDDDFETLYCDEVLDQDNMSIHTFEMEDTFTDIEISLKSLGYETINKLLKCGLHTFQLAVKDSLAEYCQFLNDIRKGIKTLRQGAYREMLTTKKLKIPFLDVETRWSSTYNMVNSLMDVITFVKDLIEKGDGIDLSDSHIKLMKKFIEVYSLAARFTCMMQKKRHYIYSILYRMDCIRRRAI